MKIRKAVITAAAPSQHTLPLQTLIDRDGVQKSVLRLLLEEAFGAGVDEVGVVLGPGDEAAYREAVGSFAGRVHWISQPAPLGYGHAVYCAREFTDGQPFLHLVGDHVYVSSGARCARQLVEVAEAHGCAVSGVQPTRENLLHLFGTVGGQRIQGAHDLYQVEQVVEKPTPTEAEQFLLVPGLRAGHYLCFLGIHVFTPAVMDLLGAHAAARQAAPGEGRGGIQLSPVLSQLAARERYLALEVRGRRYAVDVRYGLLMAQLGLALSGQDRSEVLSALCSLLAQQELEGAERAP